MTRQRYLLPAALTAAALLGAPAAHADHVFGFQFEGVTPPTVPDTEAGVGGDQFGTLNGGATVGGPNLSLVEAGANSLLVDGQAGSYLAVNNAGGLLPGGSQFTISAFINANELPGGTSYDNILFFSHGGSGTGARLALQVGFNGGFALV